MLKQKRGWIRIVEAFVAVLLITGVLLIVINKGYIAKEDISDKVYSSQWAVLREIELDQNLREEVLNPNLQIPVEGLEVPGDVINKINSRMPSYLQCVSKICELNEVCELSTTPEQAQEKDIYAQSITIAATPSVSEFNPKQLKMFCWVR